MPFDSPEALDNAIDGVKRSVDALKNDVTNRDAVVADLKTQIMRLGEAVQSSKLDRTGTHDASAVGEAVLERSHAEQILGKARRGVDYAVAPDGSGDVVVLRSVVTEEGVIPGILDAPQLRSPWLTELRAKIDARSALKWAGRGREGFERLTVAADRSIRRTLANAPDELRPIFTKERVEKLFNNSANQGAELVFDFDMPMLAERIDMESQIAPLFPTLAVQRNRVVIPKIRRGLTPFVKGVNTTDDPPKYNKSSIDTSSATYTMTGLAIASQYDEDAAEDVDWMTLGQRISMECAKALAWGRDDAIINGDTAGTHQDAISLWNPRGLFDLALLGGARDHRRAWLGLRAHAKDNAAASDLSGAANAAVAIRTARAGLKAPLGLHDCVVLVSYEFFINSLVSLSDFKTLDAYGALATRMSSNIIGPLPGQVGVIDDMPVVVAWCLTDDLETTGLFTDGTGAKTGIIVVPRSKWLMMNRRAGRIETAKDITRGVYDVVMTSRELFALDPSLSSTDDAAYFGHNL